MSEAGRGWDVFVYGGCDAVKYLLIFLAACVAIPIGFAVFGSILFWPMIVFDPDRFGMAVQMAWGVSLISAFIAAMFYLEDQP